MQLTDISFGASNNEYPFRDAVILIKEAIAVSTIGNNIAFLLILSVGKFHNKLLLREIDND